MTLGRLLGLAEAGRSAYKPTVNRGTERKPRWIREPKAELKEVQRRLLRRVFSDIPAHPASFSAPGRGGTVRAATQHVSRPYLLHLDLSGFFPSVAPRRVFERLMEVGLREDTASILTGLVTVDDQLPQGAPTSPAVSDIMLFPMDSRVAPLAASQGASYTRYVDDIAVSGGRKIETFIRRMLEKIVAQEGWLLNEKGGLFGPEERKEVLGLGVGTSGVSVPKMVRSQTRSRLRLAAEGRIKLTEAELRSLRGKIAWIFSHHPSQGRKLRLLWEAASSTS